MTTYQFLSPEWIEAVRALRAKHELPTAPYSIRVNLLVTETPFESGVLHGHIDTSAGDISIEVGELPNPDLSITITYPVAQRIFVERDEAAAMEAFLSGTMQVEGDLAVLFSLQAQTLGSANDLAESVLAITRPV